MARTKLEPAARAEVKPLEPAVVAKSQEIGAMLKAARHAAGLSQEVLAAKAKMTRSSYIRIEQGKTNVTIDSLLRIAGALGFDVTVSLTKRNPVNLRRS